MPSNIFGRFQVDNNINDTHTQNFLYHNSCQEQCPENCENNDWMYNRPQKSIFINEMSSANSISCWEAGIRRL